MRLTRPDASDVLPVSAGYDLRITWEEPRKSLNQGQVYRALRTSDGLLDVQFVDKAESLGRLSRKIEQAVGLATLAREVELAKGTSPIDLFARAVRLLELPDATILDLIREPPDATRVELATVAEQQAKETPNVSPTLPPEGSTAELDSSAYSTDRPYDFVFSLVGGRLTRDERRNFIQGLRREILNTSHKIALLERELRDLLHSSTSFITHFPLYECECGPLGQDVQGSCSLCQGVVKPAPISTSAIQPDLRTVIQANMWLELGVARIFDGAGFVTYVGSHPIGLSGAKHETDVLAWDPETKHLLLAEVSTDQASMERMAKVLLRREDIPVHAAVLVSLGDAGEDVLDYGRKHGIGVVPKLRENCSELEKWIESARGRHAKRAG